MKIYIDADACPKQIKEIMYKVSYRLKIETILVANKPLSTPYSDYLKTVVVPGGQDVADDKIVELVNEGELVVTADIPLADRVVNKDAFAINPRGKLYTKDNIKPILSNRNFMTELRNNGLITGGPPVFNQKDIQDFTNQLDRFLTKMNKPTK